MRAISATSFFSASEPRFDASSRGSPAFTSYTRSSFAALIVPVIGTLNFVWRTAAPSNTALSNVAEPSTFAGAQPNLSVTLRGANAAEGFLVGLGLLSSVVGAQTLDWDSLSQPHPLPLVISPHGRNNFGWGNAAHYWQELPADGPFALVCPDGLSRAHNKASNPFDQPPHDPSLFTYGYARWIDDLARMPKIVQATLPWIRLDLKRVYVLGSSMGGQETLLLAARYPGPLSGGTGRLAGPPVVPVWTIPFGSSVPRLTETSKSPWLKVIASCSAAK